MSEQRSRYAYQASQEQPKPSWLTHEFAELGALARCREGRHELVPLAGTALRICRHCPVIEEQPGEKQ